MEKILDVYEQKYNSRIPVICFDERPCQLIEDVITPIPMKKGKVTKQDYEYKRNGTCCVFMAIEPLKGKRYIEVKKQKTKKDYADFIHKLQKQYKDADKIILVQDNLNTHNPSSFYETYKAEQAFDLSERFEIIYTPKHASWLNMAEIELSALSKQCLDRHIRDIETLTKEVSKWTERRNKRKAMISWSFTKIRARNKLNRHYQNFKN